MAENSASFRVSSINSSQNHSEHGWFSDSAKRLMDIVVSLLALILLSPLFLWIALRIKRDSPGPVFYRGPRLGKDGREFYILKFRTMHENPESYQGPRVTAQDDPRITRFGAWLRDTKLNEFPQFWNVLIGEMSLVGPRPEDPQIAATWPKEVAREVLSVRPGVTSPASVIYRNEESLLSGERVMTTYLDAILPSKLRLDQLYVRNRSFWLDLDILLWTFLVLMPRLRTYSPAEEKLFAGPISHLFRRHLSWFIVDTVVSLIAMAIVGGIWRVYTPLDVGWPQALLITFGFALLFSLTGALLGVNRISWSLARFNDVYELIPASVLASVLALLVNQLWLPDPLLPPLMIFLSACVAFLGFVTVRYRTRLISGLASYWLTARGQARAAQERVLVIGSGESGQFIAWVLGSGRGQGIYQVVGFVDDDYYKQGLRIRGFNVLGRREDIPRLVEELDVGILIFAIHNINTDERQRLLEICAGTPARVVMMPDMLAAINSIVTQTGSRQGNVIVPIWREGKSASRLELKMFSPVLVDSWLEQLEQTSQSGDINAVQEQIRELREQLKTEIQRSS